MEFTDFLTRILFSIILGFIIGLERQYRQNLAGIRTNVLVCVGACLFVMYSAVVGSGDSSRIAGQVVTGVGFLGGGVILRDGFNVKGLNTAATLWCTASVGVLASSGNIAFASVAALIIVSSNILLRPISKKMYRIRSNHSDDAHAYIISIKCVETIEFSIRSMLMQMVGEEKIILRKLESIETENEDKVKVKAEIISMEKSDMIMERIVGVLSLELGVVSASWKLVGE